MSLASLPMYDRPETAAANDRYWQAIRTRLGEGPETLTRTGELWEHWLAPDLVLSQTCGYPYRARLHGQVTLVGTPDYGLDGCPPGHYRSIFVARADDPRTDLRAFAAAGRVVGRGAPRLRRACREQQRRDHETEHQVK